MQTKRVIFQIYTIVVLDKANYNLTQYEFFIHLPPEVSPCGWTDVAPWVSTQCIGTFPASEGIREGSDLGLIQVVDLSVSEEQVGVELSRVGLG